MKHVLLLSEGVQVNSSEFLHGFNAKLGEDVSVSGGFAGDGERFLHTRIWCNSRPLRGAAAAICFYGDRLRIGPSANGGWDPFGPERMITRSSGNVLHELDGYPALSLYKQYLGVHATGLPKTGMMYPLGIKLNGGTHVMLRSLISVDEESQSVTFGGDVPEHACARLMLGNQEHLIEGAGKAAESSVCQLDGASPTLALLISCAGRRPILGQLIEEEVDAAVEVFGNDTAVTGFYSYGEVSPVEIGGRAHVHNQTMTITCFAEV